MYFYGENDIVIDLSRSVNIFKDEKSKESFFSKLLVIYKSVERINVLRHIPRCPKCGEMSYYNSSEKPGESIWIGASEMKIPLDNGKNLVVDTILLHYVDIHYYKPEQILLDAVLWWNDPE